MKKSTGGLQYVSEFSFPTDQGFTGSAGRSEVKGYMRGGKVCAQKGVKGAKGRKSRAKGTTKAAMGGFMGPEREIAVDDVTITVPKMKGGAVHDKLRKHGAEMGYSYGGTVKKTSADFKLKRGPQKTMDHGNQPARRGRNQAEIEAGGTKRLKPGLKKGGKVKIKGVASSGGGALADAALRRARNVLKPKKHMKAPDRARGRGMSKKGMPKNVKSEGGAVYKARGGSVKK